MEDRGITAFVGAHVVDAVEGGRPCTTVVVTGDRITAVGPDGTIEPPPSARIVDVAGRTLMPGMVTSHFHSTYHELGSTPDPLGLDAPPVYQGLVAARNLETALRCGFTGAVSAGASFDVDPSLARGVAEGLIPGPRFIPGGRELSTTGPVTPRGGPGDRGSRRGARRTTSPGRPTRRARRRPSRRPRPEWPGRTRRSARTAPRP